MSTSAVITIVVVVIAAAIAIALLVVNQRSKRLREAIRSRVQPDGRRNRQQNTRGSKTAKATKESRAVQHHSTVIGDSNEVCRRLAQDPVAVC